MNDRLARHLAFKNVNWKGVKWDSSLAPDKLLHLSTAEHLELNGWFSGVGDGVDTPCKVLGSHSGLYSLDATSTPLSLLPMGEKHTCPWAVPSVPGTGSRRAAMPCLRTTDLDCATSCIAKKHQRSSDTFPKSFANCSHALYMIYKSASITFRESSLIIIN